MSTVPEYFGSLVFDDRVMKAKLPYDVYVSLKKTMYEGGTLDTAVANAVADAATHRRLGVPGLRVLATATAGLDPNRPGLSLAPAARQALERAGLTLDDLDVIELNEAFAAQALGVTREWGIDPLTDERVNPNGSGISLGHPVGATGVRILATMLREMERREARYGLETMCIGGGQGLAAVFERLS